MEMIKSYTSLEQSKKLAEILPPDSCDMWWREVSYGFYHKEAEIPKGWYDVPPKGIPCWSLAALLDVLPEINGISLKIEKVKAEDGFDGYYYPIEYEGLVLIPYPKSLVDACVEMIEKLHEQKLL